MPKFMDHHNDLPLPDEVIQNIKAGLEAGARDDFGVSQLDLYYNAEGTVYCLLDAPDADAVRKHHEAMGVSCGDVHQIDALSS